MELRDVRTGLTAMDREECLALLATHHVGRIAVVDAGSPLIFPVNYVVAEESVVFRTDAGTKLTAAEGRPVAFEVDEIDEAHEQGWSVLVRGRAEEITPYHDAASRALSALPLHPWAGGEKGHWVRITTTSVTGRRVGPGPVRPS